MKRAYLITAAVLIAAVGASAASASAAVIELGATRTRLVAPTCPRGVTPKNCTLVLTQVTALETLRDGISNPTTVTRAGRIVAFTVGLSQLSSNRTTAKAYIGNLNNAYGGPPSAEITVLHSVGARNLNKWNVVAQSQAFALQPYLGQVAQFPLETSLHVRPGDVIALTTPTWAPVLSIDVSNSFGYRQSRSGINKNGLRCSDPSKGNAQRPGQTTRYLCNYQGTRIEYSATEITDPVAVNPIR